MSLLASALLLAVGQVGSSCSLIRPVAPDEPAARRIAEAVIANVPASPQVRDAAREGSHYQLVVERDGDDPRLWVAFQRPPPPLGPRDSQTMVVQFAGHGLGFTIDSCTGAIGRMAYQR